jgi:hypothetical protein
MFGVVFVPIGDRHFDLENVPKHCPVGRSWIM